MTLDKPELIVSKANETIQDVIAKVIESQNEEEPFYIFEVEDVIHKYNTWLEKMPRVHPFYAVKCNHGFEILKVLADQGAGFDCASIAEIRRILSLGVHPDRIIFANPVKPKTYIQYACEKNVPKSTFDNELELYKVQKFFPGADLVIRIRCDAEVATSYLGEKFGCEAILEAPRLLRKAKDLGLKVIGVAFHVGSDAKDPLAYERGISEAKKLFEFAKTIGYNFHFLDIGGGFGARIDTQFNKITQVINKALDDNFPDSNEITVIAEPGRIFCGTAYTLLCNIHSKREIRDVNDNSLLRNEYYLNDGIYGSFIQGIVENRIHLPFLLNERPREAKYPSTLWGPTLDSFDKIVEEHLPNLDIGEWIGFHDMGAYTTVSITGFNGILSPTIYIMIKQKRLDLLPCLKTYKHYQPKQHVN